jgi:hypothetical protein
MSIDDAKALTPFQTAVILLLERILKAVSVGEP